MKSFKLLKNTKGITLIALVVTIVVLLILAAVSISMLTGENGIITQAHISMLTGENGIITQAQDSKDKTEQAKCEELVTVAINGLIAENGGDRSKITPEKIAEQVNKENNRTDVRAERNIFPTYMIFDDEGRKVGVNLELGVGAIESYDGIYSEGNLEGKIAPSEIFLYEIIEATGETASTEWDSLPTKEARIIGMNPEYCNSGGYQSHINETIYDNTYYEIKLKDGTILTDILVVPYQVSGKYIEGASEDEMYTITEVCLAVPWSIYRNGSFNFYGYTLPRVDVVVFPNTIKKITGKDYYTSDLSGDTNKRIYRVVLPNILKEIDDTSFAKCYLESVEIPNTIESIGDSAFSNCNSLTTVNYTGTKEEWNILLESIGRWNDNLINAKIICTDGIING